MGDPDVTLGSGHEAVWDGERAVMKVELRRSELEEIEVEAKRVAMGDWMGDPDVTLWWGSGAVWDGERDAVIAVFTWSRMEEIVPGEVGVGVVS